MKHPIQPLAKDSEGVMRFRSNSIVRQLYEFGQDHGCDMNKLATMGFSKDDWQQFAQLIGYSLSGYGELGYVTDDAYEAAVKMSHGKSEHVARIRHLESELAALRKSLRKPMARLFGVHPNDLTKNDPQ